VKIAALYEAAATERKMRTNKISILSALLGAALSRPPLSPRTISPIGPIIAKGKGLEIRRSQL
jgi:hypothetical protein